MTNTLVYVATNLVFNHTGPHLSPYRHRLYVEANEPSLSQRRDKLSLQYITKLKSYPSNPAYSMVFDPNYKVLYSNKPKAIPSFGIRKEPKMENTQIDLDLIAEYKVPETPPWTFEQPTVIFDLTSHRKSNKFEV